MDELDEILSGKSTSLRPSSNVALSPTALSGSNTKVTLASSSASKPGKTTAGSKLDSLDDIFNIGSADDIAALGDMSFDTATLDDIFNTATFSNAKAGIEEPLKQSASKSDSPVVKAVLENTPTAIYPEPVISIDDELNDILNDPILSPSASRPSLLSATSASDQTKENVSGKSTHNFNISSSPAPTMDDDDELSALLNVEMVKTSVIPGKDKINAKTLPGSSDQSSVASQPLAEGKNSSSSASPANAAPAKNVNSHSLAVTNSNGTGTSGVPTSPAPTSKTPSITTARTSSSELSNTVQTLEDTLLTGVQPTVVQATASPATAPLTSTLTPAATVPKPMEELLRSAPSTQSAKTTQATISPHISVPSATSRPSATKLDGYLQTDSTQTEKGNESAIFTVSDSSGESRSAVLKEIENALIGELPDYVRGRQLCQQLGYIPNSVRKQLWLHLIEVTPKADNNPLFLAGKYSVENYAQLQADCETAVQRLVESGMNVSGMSTGQSASPKRKESLGGPKGKLAHEMEQFIALHCTRKGSKYTPDLLTTLTPLVFMGFSPKMADTAEVFETIVSKFYPAGFTEALSEKIAGVRRPLFKKLLMYHDPELYCHLDHLYYDWTDAPHPESPLGPATAEPENSVNDSETIKSMPAKRGSTWSRSGGAIPSNWLCAPASFLSSPQVASPSKWFPTIPSLLHLWDSYLLHRPMGSHFTLFLALAIVQKQREKILKSGSGPQVVSAFASLISHPLSNATSEERRTTELSELGAFAEDLFSTTPVSFLHTLRRADATAAPSANNSHHLATDASLSPPTAVEHDTAAGTASSSQNVAGGAETEQIRADKWETNSQSSTSSNTSRQSKKSSSTGASAPASATAQGKMLNAFRMGFQGASNKLKQMTDVAAKATLELDQQEEEDFSEDEKRLSTLALMSHAAEVTPCLLGLKSSAKDRPQIRFYGLDCRPAGHVARGAFPTAYHLDPESMNDPEQIQKVIKALEPLKKAVHLCLIGQGDCGYKRMKGRRKREALSSAIQDAALLNHVSLIFVKQGFPYVSTVEAGYEACQEAAVASPTHGSSRNIKQFEVTSLLGSEHAKDQQTSLPASATSASSAPGGDSGLFKGWVSEGSMGEGQINVNVNVDVAAMKNWFTRSRTASVISTSSANTSTDLPTPSEDGKATETENQTVVPGTASAGAAAAAATASVAAVGAASGKLFGGLKTSLTKLKSTATFGSPNSLDGSEKSFEPSPAANPAISSATAGSFTSFGSKWMSSAAAATTSAAAAASLPGFMKPSRAGTVVSSNGGTNDLAPTHKQEGESARLSRQPQNAIAQPSATAADNTIVFSIDGDEDNKIGDLELFQVDAEQVAASVAAASGSPVEPATHSLANASDTPTEKSTFETSTAATPHRTVHDNTLSASSPFVKDDSSGKTSLPTMSTSVNQPQHNKKLRTVGDLMKGDVYLKEELSDVLKTGLLLKCEKIKDVPGEAEKLAVPRHLLLGDTELAALSMTDNFVTVKSVHKLTDIQRMTFKKKNSKWISLYYPLPILNQQLHASSHPSSEGGANVDVKVCNYQIDERETFVAILKENMQKISS